MKGGGSMLHNILNSNITGYASIIISISTLIYIDTQVEVQEKLANKQQKQEVSDTN